MQGIGPSINETLLDRMRSEICTLVFPADFKLQTQMLETRYETGLSVVREALSVLVGEGLVVREDRKGFRVAPMSLAEFDRITELRISIERSALEHAFRTNHPNWHSEVEGALQAMGPMLKAGDARPHGPDFDRNHRHFHFSLLNAYRSALTLDLCSRLYDQFYRYRSLALSSLAHLAGVGQDHATLANSVGTNDLAATRETLTRHILDASATVRAAMLSQGFFDESGDLIPIAERSK